jgi:long-chain acyl-CoA synthetase
MMEECLPWRNPGSPKLAFFKPPKQIEFRSELPKTAVGKLLRRELIEAERQKLGRS